MAVFWRFVCDKRYMKPVRIIFGGLLCGFVSTVHADIASVQWVRSIVQSLEPSESVQADWNQTVTTAGDYIKNKPTIPTTAADVGAVPTTRTVNGNALSADVTLDGADIAVTGYTKPATTSAIAASDTVNAAIGKLEAALAGKQDTIPANTYDAYGAAAAVEALLGDGDWEADGKDSWTVKDALDTKADESALSVKQDVLESRTGVGVIDNKNVTITNNNGVTTNGVVKSFTAEAGAVTVTRGTVSDTDVDANAAIAGTKVNAASSSVRGTTKVYTTTGSNTDGTMTQGAITTALDAKQDKLGGSGDDGKAVIASGTAGTVTYRAIDTTNGGTSASTDLITSGAVNAGLAGKVSTSTTVNGNALSSNVTLDGADIAITGYSKPATTSAIAATDTVNAAIGKLETALDGKQAAGNYVSTSTTVNGNALSSNVTLDGADIALTGYSKPASTSAVAATDTVNGAIGKLEKAILPVGTTSGTVAAGDDARFDTISTTQPSGTPPTGKVFVWFN